MKKTALSLALALVLLFNALFLGIRHTMFSATLNEWRNHSE